MERKHKYILLIILFIGLLLRLGYVLTLENILYTYIYPDEGVYDGIAVSLVEGKGYSINGIPTATRMPAYPLFLAGIYAIFGHNFIIIRIIQAVISILTCFIIFLITRELINEKTGLIACVISVVYPFFIYYTGYLLLETLFTFLITLSVWTLINFQKAPSLNRGVVSGFSMGLGGLYKPTVIPFYLLFILYLFLIKKREGIVSLLVIFVLCLVPWWVRNYLVFHEPVLFTTQSGLSLMGGNVWFEHIDSGKYIDHIDPMESSHSRIIEMNELRRDKYYKNIAINFIKENPLYFLSLMPRKFIKFWRLYPHLGMTYSYSTKLLVLVSIFSYGVLLPFSILGLWLSRTYWKRFFCLYLIIFIFSFIHMIFWSQIRYRLPVMPYVMIFASLGIKFLWDKAKKVRHV